MRRTLIGAAIGLIGAILGTMARPKAPTAHERRRELLEEIWPTFHRQTP